MKTFKTVKNLSIFDNIQNINIRIPDYLLTRVATKHTTYLKSNRWKYSKDITI